MVPHRIEQKHEPQGTNNLIHIGIERGESNCNSVRSQPLSMDTQRGDSDLHNSVRPQLHIDSHLAQMDLALQDASRLLDITRKNLNNYKISLATATNRCSTLQRAYNEEHRIRTNYDRAYHILYTHHQRAVNDLYSTTNKCFSLEKELEDALDSRPKEQYLDAQNIINTGSDGYITHQKRLEARISELEDEKAKLKQENDQALSNAVDHIRDVQQRFEGLERRYQALVMQTEPSGDPENSKIAGAARKDPKANNSIKSEVM